MDTLHPYRPSRGNVILTVALLAAFVCLGGFAWHSLLSQRAAPVEAAPPPLPSPITSLTVGTEYNLMTMTHDGHLWVLVENRFSRQGTSAIHHPDCPCLKGARP